jgi:hypothetical protein
VAYSLEVQGIVNHLHASGVTYRVTDVNTPGVHSATSWHYAEGTGGKGTAVDFAGPTPSRNSPELLAIFAAFTDVESQLVELAYLGAPYNIKNGKRVAPYDKDNHVHVAVRPGTFLGAKETKVPEVEKPTIVTAFSHEGGYVLVMSDGALYCFNCTYQGGLRWDGQAWVLR